MDRRAGRCHSDAQRDEGCIPGRPSGADSLRHYAWHFRFGGLVARNSGALLAKMSLRRFALGRPCDDSPRGLMTLFHTRRLLHADSNERGAAAMPAELARWIRRAARSATDLAQG